MSGQPTQVKIDEVVSRVRAIDGTHAIAPETVRSSSTAMLPAVREMLDHDRQVRMEGVGHERLRRSHQPGVAAMTLPVKGTMFVQTGAGRLRAVRRPVQPDRAAPSTSKRSSPRSRIPGLDAPIQQFVRGNAEKLTLELFCDTTEDGIGINATVGHHRDRQVLSARQDRARRSTRRRWSPSTGTHEFSGNRVGDAWGGHRRTSFTGVAESVRQRFTMFSPEGVPLRATVTLVLREWRPIEEQLDELNPSRRTARTATASGGETLIALAARYYDRAADWRPIADDNEIEDPRRLLPGRVLTVPSLARDRDDALSRARLHDARRVSSPCAMSRRTAARSFWVPRFELTHRRRSARAQRPARHPRAHLSRQDSTRSTGSSSSSELGRRPAAASNTSARRTTRARPEPDAPRARNAVRALLKSVIAQARLSPTSWKR